YLPGHHGPHAAVLLGEPVHLQRGQHLHRQAAAGAGRRASGPRPLHRPAATIARPDRHRDWLRDDRPLPRRPARRPRPQRHRPRRRHEGGAMMPLSAHLLVVPVVLPVITAAAHLLLGDKRRLHKSRLNVLSTLLGLLVAPAILARVDHGHDLGAVSAYFAASWEAPYGIVLVADRLSALMLVLVGIVGLCAALYAEATWVRASVYFHPLFQIQLMGLNGAFLTGDLFNLFVFFEVMLAASYGLQLHGSGWPRVSSGLHYIVVNLLASSLFLVGLSVLYGVLGTL